MKHTKKQTFIRAILIIIGIILILDTIFTHLRSNWNLGVILPAIFGAPLLLYGLFKPRIDRVTSHGAPKIIKRILTIGYFAVIGIIIVFSLLAYSASRTTPQPGADAIIVLGAGIRGDQVTYSLQNRLDTAARYYTENPDTIVIVSGGYGVGKQFSEAYAMKKYLLENTGVPATAIIEEDRSTSTMENFMFSKEILDKKLGRPYSVVYVTNDFHILRSGIIAKRAGLNAQGLPAPTPLYITPNSYMRESLALLYTFVSGS